MFQYLVKIYLTKNTRRPMTIQCQKESGILLWDTNCNSIIPLFYNYGMKGGKDK